MQIELDFSNQIPFKAGIITALIFVIFGLGTLGYGVTPVEADQLVLLTPERWQAAGLARQAMAEVVVIQRDLGSLNQLLAGENPDPVAAMVLAQRIYANHKTGTSATATVRTTLIDAAVRTARYATGTEERNDAVDALMEVEGHLVWLTRNGG